MPKKKLNYPKIVGEKLKEIGETAESALWDCHGTLCVYHKALERIAAAQGVSFDDPQLISVDLEAGSTGSAAVWVRGHLGEKSEWSYGEASQKNSKNKFPLAMAEKRAKDRVILKLIGLHGYVYSDDELEDTNDNPVPKQKDPATEAAPEEPAPAPVIEVAKKGKPVTKDKLQQSIELIKSGKHTVGEITARMQKGGYLATEEQIAQLSAAAGGKEAA